MSGISSVSTSLLSSASTQAQVTIAKKAQKQTEAVVGKILEGVRATPQPTADTGKQLNISA